jgi:uncharacterized membrane protein YgdD (TMEM256/DUF423 family)
LLDLAQRLAEETAAAPHSAVAVALYDLVSTLEHERAGYLFIVGSLLFQGTVLAKSCVSIAPFGILTPSAVSLSCSAGAF